MAALVPPDAYGIVEPGVYRSNVLQPSNFAFIATLQLRKVLILSPEMPTRAVAAFLEENRIELVWRRRTRRQKNSPSFAHNRHGRPRRRLASAARCIWASGRRGPRARGSR